MAKSDKRQLNPRQAKFVEEYAKTGVVYKAAEAAGYSPKTARGNVLLRESPAVKEAVEKIRNQAVERGLYNLEAAMKEADAAIEFAKETENANAYVKAVELKTKLNGLLIEKHDHRMSNFQLNISGIDDKPPAIDVAASVVSKSDDEDEEENEETNQVLQDEEEDLIG